MGIYDRDWYREERREKFRIERERDLQLSMERDKQRPQPHVDGLNVGRAVNNSPDLPMHPFLLGLVVAGVCTVVFLAVNYFIG